MYPQNQKEISPSIFSEETELKRELGLTESISIVFGRIIGSGIFRTPGLIMAAVGGFVGLFYGAWIIGGIATLFAAFCYSEMAAMMPRSGGPYTYLKAAYPPIWTFLRGWAMFFVSETGAIVSVALVFAEYGNVLFSYYFDAPYSHLSKIIITFVIIWSLTLVNCYGVRFSGLFQNIFGFLKLVALFSIIGFSFSASGNFENMSQNIWPDEWGMKDIIAIGVAMRYCFFAYSGWEGATYVAEEVKNPRRNLPLSILLGISGVVLLYLSVNSAYLYQLSPAEFIDARKSIASESMTSAVGVAGGLFVAGAVMMSVFGNVSSQILVKGRTWYAMARDGYFPAFFGKLSSRFKTPNNALLAQGIWATVILGVASLMQESYRGIIDFFSFTSATFNVSTILAVWLLRKKYPAVNRPYRAWGYPFTLIIVLIIQIAFMIITLYDAFLPSLMGVLLTSTGLLYFYRRKIFRLR